LKDHLCQLTHLALHLPARRSSPPLRDTFADAVIDYTPARFCRGFTNPAVVLGAPTSTANPFSPAFRTPNPLCSARRAVTVRFDTPIQNDSATLRSRFHRLRQRRITITNGKLLRRRHHRWLALRQQHRLDARLGQRGQPHLLPVEPLFAPIVDDLPHRSTGISNLPGQSRPRPRRLSGQNLAGIAALYAGSAGGPASIFSWRRTPSQQCFLSDINYVRVDVRTGKSEI